MARAIHVFRTPDRFVAGTVGQPGNRTFYLQAVHDKRVVSVMLEKQQVAVLAERISPPELSRAVKIRPVLWFTAKAFTSGISASTCPLEILRSRTYPSSD